jgi:hypothetical protein
MVPDQASINSIALFACPASRVMHHNRAWVYAALASSRSSEQPRFGLERDPHSTVARGLG